MDLEKIKAQIEVLRQRRMSLPELTDYRPQRGKAKAASPVMVPVNDKPAEDIFSNLFVATEEVPSGEPSTIEPATVESPAGEGDSVDRSVSGTLNGTDGNSN